MTIKSIEETVEQTKCEKCGQDLFIVSPDGKKFKCLCKCQKEAMLQAELDIQRKQHDYQVAQKKTCSLLGKRYANATFETAQIDANNEQAYKIAQSYCDKYKEMLDKGFGFYVCGPVGTGKTHLLACVCNFLTERLQDCAFTNFMNICNEIKQTYNSSASTENVLDKYSKMPFLFIDDLGKESYKKANGDAGWLDEQLFLILNNRYNNMLPTFFSSNYDIEEFVTEFGFDNAIIDRIKAMATRIINLKGENRRNGNVFE